MMDVLKYLFTIHILFLQTIEFCQNTATTTIPLPLEEGTFESTEYTTTTTATFPSPQRGENFGHETDWIYVCFPIVVVLAVIGGALLAICIVKKRQSANVQFKRKDKVYWRVYDAVENKPKDFMRLKAGARARLVDVPKPSTNHYSEILLDSTQSMFLPDNLYSSVYIDIPTTVSYSDDNNYDTIRQSVNFNTTMNENKNRPAYDHVMVMPDVLKGPKGKDSFSHLNLPKVENSQDNLLKVKEERNFNQEGPSKGILCERKDHEYYVLDPDGNLYIVHECNGNT